MKKVVVRRAIVRLTIASWGGRSARFAGAGLASLALVTVSALASADPPAAAPTPATAPTVDPASPAAPASPSVAPAEPAEPAPTLTPSATAAPIVSIGDPAHAPPSPNDQTKPLTALPSDVRSDVPVIALTHSAFGARAGKVGAHGFGHGTGASSGSVGGGGLTLYGSPINRLTLLATAERFDDKHFAPSASLAYRILGSLEDGWALAAMGTYKAEGFAEMEGEVELGVMFSLLRDRWHFDFNAVAGGGLEESEEFDAEAKLRVGYDVTDWFRVGLDSRGRYRLRGDRTLVGGRKGDFIGGPQVIASWSQFYGALLAGPSTVDIASNVGAAGWVTVGGMLP